MTKESLSHPFAEDYQLGLNEMELLEVTGLSTQALYAL
jgi:hypothetical protein